MENVLEYNILYVKHNAFNLIFLNVCIRFIEFLNIFKGNNN